MSDGALRGVVAGIPRELSLSVTTETSASQEDGQDVLSIWLQRL
jgi:hypothetical protein